MIIIIQLEEDNVSEPETTVHRLRQWSTIWRNRHLEQLPTPVLNLRLGRMSRHDRQMKFLADHKDPIEVILALMYLDLILVPTNLDLLETSVANQGMTIVETQGTMDRTMPEVTCAATQGTTLETMRKELPGEIFDNRQGTNNIRHQGMITVLHQGIEHLMAIRLLQTVTLITRQELAIVALTTEGIFFTLSRLSRLPPLILPQH